MGKKTWAEITAGIALGYDLFLIVQAFVPVWPTERIHSMAELGGGILLIVWAILFWKGDYD